MKSKRILVVANQTAIGEHLKEILYERAMRETVEVTLLVPATPPNEGWTWTEARAHALAEQRMHQAVAGLRELDIPVRGHVGDARPLDAIADVLTKEPVDEIIVSTLPWVISRWLKSGLPRKARRFGLPVIHVTGEDILAEDPVLLPTGT